MPNCESFPISWMIADTDDWVPRRIAPFIWLNREPAERRAADTTREMMPGEASTSKAIAKNKSSPLPSSKRITNGSWNKTKIRVDGQEQEQAEASTSSQSWLVSANGDATREQLRMPLLSSSGDERAGPVEEQQASPSAAEEEGDAKKRKRRARVMDLGRRMGDKLEEKGKRFVGKMRENARNNRLLLPDLEQATTPPAPAPS
jgi:hypothetical protein